MVLLGLYYRENSRRRRREIAKYIENVTGNMDVATKDTMVNSPAHGDLPAGERRHHLDQ